MPGILVGIDGSGHSERALEWAMKEAALRHTSVTVLAVRQAVSGWGGAEPYPGDKAAIDEFSQKAKAETDKVLAGLDGPHPESVTVRTVQGFPAEEIVSEGAKADMIVLGTRGGGGWPKQVMGSVSREVTHHSTVPVVVIPAERKH
jgi:nucleotide-binding universal stress UspA family protein